MGREAPSTSGKAAATKVDGVKLDERVLVSYWNFAKATIVFSKVLCAETRIFLTRYFANGFLTKRVLAKNTNACRIGEKGGEGGRGGGRGGGEGRHSGRRQGFR